MISIVTSLRLNFIEDAVENSWQQWLRYKISFMIYRLAVEIGQTVFHSEISFISWCSATYYHHWSFWRSTGQIRWKSSPLRRLSEHRHFISYISFTANYYYEVKFNVAIVIPIPQNTLSMKYVVPYHPRSFRWNGGLRQKKNSRSNFPSSCFSALRLTEKWLGQQRGSNFSMQ